MVDKVYLLLIVLRCWRPSMRFSIFFCSRWLKLE